MTLELGRGALHVGRSPAGLLCVVFAYRNPKGYWNHKKVRIW